MLRGQPICAATPGTDAQRLGLVREMTLANFAGRVQDALATLDLLRAQLSDDVCPWICLNAMIDTLVMAGQYRAALELPLNWSARAREQGALGDPRYVALAHVNMAEALYNMGRVEEAWQMVQRVSAELGDDAVALAGVRLQQAWIAVLRREPAAALEVASEVRVRALPFAYHAELRYTKASALCALGRHAAARREALAGCQCAVRASSARNGLFLLASIALGAGDIDRALLHFEAAMKHPYQAQGGAALFAYAQLLGERGQMASACATYRALLERDPEHPLCAAARDALRRVSAAELGVTSPRSR
jgi:tetratricopeptide (TPR) repeat protein